MIIICWGCGKMLGKGGKGHGVSKELCFDCGLPMLAEAGNLSREEADVYNDYLCNKIDKQQAMGKMLALNK
jgi:hypothetical protein